MSAFARCDICGEPLGRDPISVTEPPDFTDLPDLGIDDVESSFWESLADVLEERGALADYTLANAIREKHGFDVHRPCLTDTNWPSLFDELDEVAARMIEEDQIDVWVPDAEAIIEETRNADVGDPIESLPDRPLTRDEVDQLREQLEEDYGS